MSDTEMKKSRKNTMSRSPCLERRMASYGKSSIGQMRRRPKSYTDLTTYWFGLNANENKATVNSDLYGDIILASEFPDKMMQFPRLVSFVGNTGAGKSTIIVSPVLLYVTTKCLTTEIIKQKAMVTDGQINEPKRSWLQSPIPGLPGFLQPPTSSDVHLYCDPMTIHTDKPILLADCEGLMGGYDSPVAAFLEETWKFARYGPTVMLILAHVLTLHQKNIYLEASQEC